MTPLIAVLDFEVLTIMKLRHEICKPKKRFPLILPVSFCA